MEAEKKNLPLSMLRPFLFDSNYQLFEISCEWYRQTKLISWAWLPIGWTNGVTIWEDRGVNWLPLCIVTGQKTWKIVSGLSGYSEALEVSGEPEPYSKSNITIEKDRMSMLFRAGIMKIERTERLPSFYSQWWKSPHQMRNFHCCLSLNHAWRIDIYIWWYNNTYI